MLLAFPPVCAAASFCWPNIGLTSNIRATEVKPKSLTLDDILRSLFIRQILTCPLMNPGLIRFRPRPSRQISVSRNQACAAFIREVRPCPLDEHEHAVAESDEKENMD